MSDLTRQFGDFYGQYSAWLRQRLVRRYGYQEADDLAQETWLRFMPYHANGDVVRPRALLLTIAGNLAADLGRRQKRRGAAMASSHLISHEAPLQAEELTVKELILSLPRPLRDVFVLSRFGGLTNRQIAEQLGISPKTVEWRMTKALAHCAAQLKR